MDAKPFDSQRAVILVGTENSHKVDEIRDVLARLWPRDAPPLEVRGPQGLPKGPPVEETGETFRDNAEIKARAYAERARQLSGPERPRWVLADDSGLCVDALDGHPGVRSSRYSGENASDEENNRKLLGALQAVTEEDRGAEFVCVIACMPVLDSDGERNVRFFVEGRCRGTILREPRGAGGFGYDPLFLFPPLGKTFAELGRDEKSRWSHRGQALRELGRHIADLVKLPTSDGPEEP